MDRGLLNENNEDRNSHITQRQTTTATSTSLDHHPLYDFDQPNPLDPFETTATNLLQEFYSILQPENQTMRGDSPSTDEVLDRSTEIEQEEQNAQLPNSSSTAQPSKTTEERLLDLHDRLDDLGKRIKSETKKIQSQIRKEQKQTMESFKDSTLKTIDEAEENIRADYTNAINNSFQSHPILSQFSSLADIDSYINSKIQTAISNSNLVPPPSVPQSSSSSSAIKSPFTSLKKRSDYRQWRQEAPTHCAVHPSFAHLTTTNNNGEFILRNNLNKTENALLFSILCQSVGKELTNPILLSYPQIGKQSDGMELLDQMEQAYNVIKTDYLTQEKLHKNIQAIYKETTETNLKYVARFTESVTALQEAVQGGGNNSFKVPPPNMLAYYLIKGLQRPNDFREMLMELQADTSAAKAFYRANNLNYTMTKAQERILSLEVINASTTPSPTTPLKQSRTKQPPGTAGTKNKVTPQPVKEIQHQYSEEQNQFFKEANADTTAALKKWYNTNKTKCSLNHGDDNHSFLDCKYVKSFLWRRGKLKMLNDLKPSPSTARGTNIKAKQVIIDKSAYEQFKQWQTQSHRGSSTEADGISEVTSDFSEAEYTSDDNTNNSVSTYPPAFSSCSIIPSISPPLPQSILKSYLSSTRPLSSSSVSFSQDSIPSHNINEKSTNIICKAKYIPSPQHAPTTNKAIADSGSSHHLFNAEKFFEYIVKFTEKGEQTPFALLGDDITAVEVKGYGMINILLNGKRVRHMAYYVPSLQTNLLSMKEHMKFKGCFFHCEDNEAVLAFPGHILQVKNEDELYLEINPATKLSDKYIFNEDTATLSSSKYTKFNIVPRDFTSSPSKAQENKLHFTVQARRIIKSAHLDNPSESSIEGIKVKSTSTVKIGPSQKRRIHTGIACNVPQDIHLQIKLSPSLTKRNITSEITPITSSHNGEIVIDLFNDSYKPVRILAHTSIGRLMFMKGTIPLATPTLDSKPTSTSPTTSKGGKPKLTVFHLASDSALLINKQTMKCKKVKVPQTELFCTEKFDEATIKVTTLDPDESTPINPFLHMMNEKPPSSLKEKTVPLNKPVIRPNEKVDSSNPKTKYITRDHLLQSTGFLNADNLIKNFNILGNQAAKIQQLPKNDTLNPGEVASLNKSRSNKTPSTPPANYGDVMHCDIGFGPVTAIGGVKFALMVVDKATRKIHTVPLKGLKEKHMVRAFKKLTNIIGFAPKVLRTDFDQKIIGGKTREYLEEKNIQVEAAPPRRQDKNGLVERSWQTVVRMARNWMTAAQLPSKYWWFAIKRACEVKNILPTKHLNTTTTPHELVHGNKVDYRQLFPMFSAAYIRQARENGQDKNKWASKTLKCILVGSCDKSDGLLFYHPPSKQLLTCGEGYKLDTFSPSGPQFNEKFDGGFIFNTKADEMHFHRPPSHELNNTKYIKQEDKHIPVKIITQPLNEEDEKYIVQEVESGNIHHELAENILDHNPTADPTAETTDLPFPHHQWIQHRAKATLYLQDRMKKPKQGRLIHVNNEWKFQVGRTRQDEIIDLQNFDQLASSLIHNKKLFQGWKRTSIVMTARYLRAVSNMICKKTQLNPHISARELETLQSPTLMQHKNLSPNDRKIWDAAYSAEYFGLEGIDTWEMISEEEYQVLKKTMGPAMPTMAVSTIKYDQDGKPKRAKYRIVALGNLDPYPWSKSDCFAPVLSQPELRLLTSIATKLKVIPKTADVSQAFCQSYLPADEPYVLKPPAGCTHTPKGMYWKLKKTLYGLKRSPRHWYELARKTLLELGLKQNPSTPCIFTGRLDKSLPPIYIGFYVDDFIYFSEDPATEKLFEQRFSATLPCTFNDNIDHFLGIKFTSQRHTDGNLSIYLNQPAFIENILHKHNLSSPAVNTVQTPFRSGYAIDTIENKTYDKDKQRRLTKEMQELVGSLNWLAISTRPDIATAVNLLARHMSNPSSGHLLAAKRVLRYLKGTPNLGIAFHSKQNQQLEAYLKFPICASTITSFADANWGPQDASVPKPNQPAVSLDLFKSRSLSGFLIWHTGPIHWMSKRQTITARSSAESEIYATDECCKALQHLANIIEDMGIKKEIMNAPTIIYNDNAACVCWSTNLTTKGLRHIQIRENATREQIKKGLIKVEHIAGKINLSDFFTKEEKSTEHFLTCRKHILETPPIIMNTASVVPTTPPNSEQQNLSAQGPGGCSSGTSLPCSPSHN